MADMIRTGAKWFEGKRVAHATTSVIYRYDGTATDIPCNATVSTDTRQNIDAAGALITIQIRTFLIAVSQLANPPKRSDRITMVEEGVTKVYSVASLDPRDKHWTWGDAFELTRKITAIPV
jgi:hypothetical protein